MHNIILFYVACLFSNRIHTDMLRESYIDLQTFSYPLKLKRFIFVSCWFMIQKMYSEEKNTNTFGFQSRRLVLKYFTVFHVSRYSCAFAKQIISVCLYISYCFSSLFHHISFQNVSHRKSLPMFVISFIQSKCDSSRGSKQCS